MRTSLGRFLTVVLAISLSLYSFCNYAYAAESDSLSFSLAGEPAKYTFVKGDASTFRALNWQNDGYVAGVKDVSAAGDWHGVTVEGDGHAVAQEGDYKGLLSLKKEGLGYIAFNYDQFRKYYSNAGGFYQRFDHLAENYTDKELALDIGKFGVEVGLTMEDIPEIILNYERSFKEGAKSRLSWGTVYDTASMNGSSVIQKKIAPSWENIDEITDSFNIKMSDVFKEFNWNVDQHWEFTHTKEMREDQALSSEAGAAASHYSHVDVYQQPRTNLMSTALGVDRWFVKDKVYVSSGYRFSDVDSTEMFKLFAVNPNGTYQPGGTNYLASPADNHFTTNTWVASLMLNLFKPLTAIARLKAETSERRGKSTWSIDSSTAPAAPDGIENTANGSEGREDVMQYGESFSLRYTGIPWMAVYNDYDFSQAMNDLNKERQSINANDQFKIQVFDSIFREAFTLGTQIYPLNHVTITMQGRHKQDDNNYDPTPYISGETATNIQTWIKKQGISTDEASARIAWKPCRWIQPSLRYQLSNQYDKTWSVPDNNIPVRTQYLLNTYTTEFVSQPLDDLLLSASFSLQDGKVRMPDSFIGYPEAVPTFNLDVYSMLFSSEYSITKDWMITATTDYNRATNYQDFSATGLPYGADFHQLDVIVGLRWEPKKELTIEPKYAFYQYRANQSEVGSYNAQMISIELKTHWG